MKNPVLHCSSHGAPHNTCAASAPTRTAAGAIAAIHAIDQSCCVRRVETRDNHVEIYRYIEMARLSRHVCAIRCRPCAISGTSISKAAEAVVPSFQALVFRPQTGLLTRRLANSTGCIFLPLALAAAGFGRNGALGKRLQRATETKAQGDEP